MAETLGAKDSVPAHQFSVFSTVRIATGGMVFVLCLILGIVSATIAADDSYIAGYAAAVLQHEFNVPGAVLQVQEGVVMVTADSLGTVDRQKVIAALEKIPGVVRAEVREGPAPSAVPAGPPQAAIQQELPKSESKFLPHGLLVAPFHADPRWPHFSIASRQVSSGQEPRNTGSANFGETFALYRNAAPLDGQWEIAHPGRSVQYIQYECPVHRRTSSTPTIPSGCSPATGPVRSQASSACIIRVHTWGMNSFSTVQTPINRINLSFEELDLKIVL